MSKIVKGDPLYFKLIIINVLKYWVQSLSSSSAKIVSLYKFNILLNSIVTDATRFKLFLVFWQFM